MKPIPLIALLMVLVLLLTACTTDSTPGGETAAPPAGTAAASGETVPPQTDVQTEPGTEAPETETAFLPPDTELPPEARPAVEEESLSEPTPARDYAQVRDLLAGYDYGRIPAGNPGEGEDLPGGDSGIEALSCEPEVPGVVRPERICTDGQYLYLLDSYGLTILSAEGENSRMLCTIQVEREPNSYLEEMFVGPDRVGIVYTCASFGQDENGNWFDTNSTHLVVYDTSDKSAPVRLRDCGIEGSYLESRMTEGVVLLLTNRYYWSVDPAAAPESVIPGIIQEGTSVPIPADRIWLCPNPNSTALTVAAAVSLEDGKILDSLAFTDASTSVLVEAGGVWLGRPVFRYGASAPYADGSYTVEDRRATACTELKYLSLADGLDYVNSCRIDGRVPGRYCLGRTDAGLCLATERLELNWRVFTDEARGWSNDSWGEVRRGGLLTILDDNLQPAGMLERPAGDAAVTACRFSGSLALLLTSGETGSVIPVDLSNPAAPAAGEPLPEVKPEELSAFLPEGSILCIGSETRGLRLRLLGPDGAGSLKLLAKTELEGVAGTPAQTDGSLLLAEPGYLGFSADCVEETDYSYLLLPRSGEEFGDPVEFTLPYLPTDARGLLLDGVLYICSAGTTYAADPETGELLATLTNAEG